jgi:hypothetical protein
MANEADNCHPELTHLKQVPTNDPHSSPRNIIPSSNPGVNYFLSSHTLRKLIHWQNSSGPGSQQYIGCLEVQSHRTSQVKILFVLYHIQMFVLKMLPYVTPQRQQTAQLTHVRI